MTSARTEAVAYRIWAFATPKGWDLTIREIADGIDEPLGRVRRIVVSRGWHHRLRSATLDYGYGQFAYAHRVQLYDTVTKEELREWADDSFDNPMEYE